MCRVAVDDPHLVAAVEQRLDHVRADESATPGDENPHLSAPRWARLEPVIDVILPVLDETPALPGVLASLPAGYRAIVVDNGSTDGSGQLAADLGARVVLEPQRGFGAACFAGLMAADSDVVCFMDCDGSLDGSDLPKVTGPVADRPGRPGPGPAARRQGIVAGARPRRQRGAGGRSAGPPRRSGFRIWGR